MIHTELFTQYIANNGGAENALPSLFGKVPNITIDDEITTFKDAFILNFCDREIGFETEELFALKLEARAKLVLPFYISKLKQLASIDYINAKRTESENRTSTGSAQDSGSDTVSRESTGNVTDSGSDTVTREKTGNITDSGSDTVTREKTGNITDSGSDTVTRESTGTVTDSGKDTNTRFKGENPLIDTTLAFNVKAVSEQETAETGYGKTTTSSGNGSDVTSYGKATASSENGSDVTSYGKATASSENGSDVTAYGKKTDTTGSENVTREYTDSGIEARDLYERVLNDTMNVWHEIFKKFDSLFMQVW